MSGAIFKTASQSIALNRLHSAPYPVTVRRVQPHDISRGGVFYLYDRGIKIREHRLLFTRIAPAVAAALLDFGDAVKGAQIPFTWVDPLWGERSVHLTSKITIKEPLPNNLSVALTLAEYLNLDQEPYIGADGDILWMADGSDMLGAP
jgi:hypothetical protein